jgi:hypothetical protein
MFLSAKVQIKMAEKRAFFALFRGFSSLPNEEPKSGRMSRMEDADSAE